MYKSGEVKLSVVCSEEYGTEEYDKFMDSIDWSFERLIIYDSRELEGKIIYPVAYLPHSCDQWVIGGKEEVQQMIEDLKVILEKL